MTVYERWLIAKGNVFLPSAASVAKLIEKLAEEGWVPASGGHAVKTVENTFGDDSAAKRAASTEPLPKVVSAEWLADDEREEIRLVWPVAADAKSPPKYPLSRRPDGGVSWKLEVHRAPEYVVPVASGIGALPTTCRCSEDLSFEWDEDEVVAAFERSTGIFAECDECSRTFDPSKGNATIENPFDGTNESVPGGAAYRFALKVDCGACYADDPTLAFDRELVALVEKEFGRAFYEVGALR